MKAKQRGGRFLLGTDAGSIGVEQGYAVFDEIECSIEAGLTLEDTLQAATANARRHFGPRFPVLGKGSPFDSLLLAESPFEQRQTLRCPLWVWRGCDG